MDWIDIIITAVIGLSIITGLFRGLVKESISIMVWVLAIWLSIHYSVLVEPYLAKYIHQETAKSGAAFLIVFFSTLLTGGIINAFLSFLLKQSGLSGTDRVLGMGFGFIRGVFIVSIMIVGIRITGMPESDYRNHSYLYAKFDPVVNWIAGYMPMLIQRMKSIDTTPDAAPKLLQEV